MKGEIEALLLSEGAGEGIVTPGGEIGPGIGEVAAEQGRRRGDRLGQCQRSGLVGGIHAVSPEQNRSMSKT
jgi:hypothetical protein